MNEEVSFEETTGSSKSLRKYVLIGTLAFLLFASLVFFYLELNKPSADFNLCGDGSSYGNCSEIRPYQCVEGVLVENVSGCGCPPHDEKIGDICYNSLKQEPELRTFYYVEDGVLKELNFTVYKKMEDYILGLPRTLSYSNDSTPQRLDFELMKLGNERQREAILPLVVEIENLAPWSKDEQAKIAISLVQNIPYGEPDPIAVFVGPDKSRVSRYPYQVLYENKASCEGKSELLALLLKELGFDVSLFYYQKENHEAVGVKCPVEYSLNNTGFCFVETTMNAPISYSEGRYIGVLGSSKLGPYTEMIRLTDGGLSLGDSLEDYKDTKKLRRLVAKVDKKGYLNYFEKDNLDKLRSKYKLAY